jgi:hypothetical protein
MTTNANIWGICPHCNTWHNFGQECPTSNIEIKYEPMNSPMPTAVDKQVDGDHYKKLNIQPAVYSYKNFGPAWHQGEIIKYVTRYRDKNGRKDLEKAIHLLEMLIELEYED